jgi:ParB family chromosome partitioning protein
MQCDEYSNDEYPIPLSTKLISPLKLSPHPMNADIYGADEDVSDLVELIKVGGEIRPLIVTPFGTIISGHRRNRAATILGWSVVPVEVREFDSPIEEIGLLLRENTYRNRTLEQRIREGWCWEMVEAAFAKQRQVAALKQNQVNSDDTVRVNLPERQELSTDPEARRTRNRVAARVGVGGSSYARASKVLKAIDLMEQEYAQLAVAWKRVLNNQSIDAAYKLLKSPPLWRERVLQVISTGQADTTIKAIAHLKTNTCTLNSQLEQENQQTVEPEKFRVGDLVRVNLNYMKDSSDLLKWNGYWGEVLNLSLIGSLKVDMGASILNLMPKDVLKVDEIELEQARRILNLKKQQDKLNDLEQIIVNFLQKQSYISQDELVHLQAIEQRMYARQT